MCDMRKKLEIDFFNFAAERVCYIGEDITEELDQELDQLIQQIRKALDPHLWNRYELKYALYHDRTLYSAYKQGFIDALCLFNERNE